MTISTLEMTHDEWLGDRNKGLGGSDVATVLGLNKYKSLFQLWLEKTGQTKIEYTESEAAYWGNTLEEIVAKEFQERTGKKVIRRNQVFEHHEFPFLRANIDRWVTKENAILECKTANQYLGKEWEGDEIPISYLCQVQHYMNVLNVKKAYIAVLIGGQKFVWKEVKRDQELINIIQERLVEFWENYVIRNVEPPIDGEVSTADYLKEHYKNVSEREIILSSSFDELIEQKKELNQSKKSVEESIRQIDNELVKELGRNDASIGISPQNVIRWSSVSTKRLNNDLLKSKYPEIAKDPDIYKTSDSRRLTIKEIK